MLIVRIVVRLAVVAGAFLLATKVVDGIDITGGFWTFAWIALLFTVVNAIVGPLLRLLTLPLVVVTLGLFLLVINAALLALTALLSPSLTVDGFVPALLGGLIIAVVSWVGELVLPVRAASAA